MLLEGKIEGHTLDDYWNIRNICKIYNFKWVLKFQGKLSFSRQFSNWIFKEGTKSLRDASEKFIQKIKCEFNESDDSN